MKKNTIKNLVKENAINGFFVDNKTYQGFEEKNETYLIIENNPVKTNVMKNGLFRMDKSIVYYLNKNKEMLLSQDSKEGFLYQVKEINKKRIFNVKNNVVVEEMLFEKENVYSIDQKNNIEKINKTKYNNLTHYEYDESDVEIKEDKKLSLSTAIAQQKSLNEKYSKELKKYSNRNISRIRNK